MKKWVGGLIIVLGIFSAIQFFKAGLEIKNSANRLTSLRSQSGDSVAEAYYQEMGNHGLAYSSIAYACGLAITSLCLGLGGLLFGNQKGAKDPAGKRSNERLFECTACGADVSSEDQVCPKCNADISEFES